MNNISFRPPSTRPTAGVLLAALLLLAGPAAAQSAVTGEFTTTSVEKGLVPVSADTYLLGMGHNPNREQDPQWTFDAAEVEVVLTVDKMQRVGVVNVREDTETHRFTHLDASGALVAADTLSYLVALSDRPWDPTAAVAMDTVIPDARLDPSTEIRYDSEPLLADGYVPEGESVQEYHFERDWPNLRYSLSAPTEPITLRGDFRVIVYDMTFQVEDGASTTTEYETGAEDNKDGFYRPLTGPPVERYNDTRAELVFRDATFTLHPEGYPLDLFMREADLEVDGLIRFRDANGVLRTPAQETHLHGSLLQVNGKDLRATLSPVPRPGDIGMILGVTLMGGAEQVIVDGNHLELQPDSTSTTPKLPSHWAWLGVLPLLAFLTLAGRLAADEHMVRKRPDTVAHRAGKAIDRRKLRRALRLSGRVLSRHPRHGKAAEAHAMALMAQGTPRTAAAILEPLVGTPDDHGNLSLLRCVSLHLDGQVKEAQHGLLRAVERHPGLAQVLRGTPLMDLYRRGDDPGGLTYA